MTTIPTESSPISSIEDSNVMMTCLMNPSEYPVGTHVELTGLTQKEYNGKVGIVQSTLDPSTGRQQVSLDSCVDTHDNDTATSPGSRLVGLKPINLRFVPRPMETLSVKELKSLLTFLTTTPVTENKNSKQIKNHNNNNSFIAGLDKRQLRDMVNEKVHSDPYRIAAILSHLSCVSSSSMSSSSSSHASATKTSASAASSASLTTEQIQAQVEVLKNTSPEQLKQQAQMMRMMDPNAIRQMNPHMASLTNEQIQMAITQLDMLANNPTMIQTVSEQMKHMTVEQLQQQQTRQVQQQGTMNPIQEDEDDTVTINNSTKPILNPQQIQQGVQSILQMTPQQMREQAETLRTMDPDLIRQVNPTMKHLSNAQIQLVITQLETMANQPPEVLQKIVQQMSNMTPDQFNQMNCEFQNHGSTNNNSNSTTTNTTLKNQNKTPSSNNQIQQMIQMVKQNPTLVKEMIQSQYPDLVQHLSDTQFNQMISTFTTMEDKNIQRILTTVTTIQNIQMKFQYHKKKIISFLFLFFLGCIQLYVWKKNHKSSFSLFNNPFLNYNKKSHYHHVLLHEEEQDDLLGVRVDILSTTNNNDKKKKEDENGGTPPIQSTILKTMNVEDEFEDL